MHNDESLPTSRPPAGGNATSTGIKLPAASWAKSAATPGGVPPMFLDTQAQAPGPRGDMTGH